MTATDRRPTRRRTSVIAVAITALLIASATAVVAGPWASGQAPRSFDAQGPLNAIATWALGFDSDDAEGAMEAFTDDPTFVFTLEDGTELPAFEGYDALLALFAGAIDDQAPTEQRRHVTTNHLVEQVDARTARVTSYLTLLQSTADSLDPDVISTGVYTDTIVRGRDNVWRIDRRELVLDTSTADDDLTP